MPWTLYRYILKELLKLLVISTAVLVLVIGFAATVKPLMDNLLGPVGMVKLLLYTIPTVLGYALPFSAAFASTMVLYRMAADNEIQACRAVGLSYGTILVPVVFLGLILTLTLYYMSNWVVPQFYRSAEGMIQKNLVQMILTQVQKREPVEIPGTRMVVYANHAYEVEPTHNPAWKHQPDRLLVFEGVAAGRIVDRELRNEATAERAEVLLYRVEGETWIQMRLTNVLAVDQGHLVQAASAPMTPIRVPNPLKDRIRFLSWPELRQMMRNPDQFDDVSEPKQALVQIMAREGLLRQVESMLAAGQAVTLIGAGEQETYTLQAARSQRQGHSLILLGDGQRPVRVEQFERGLVRSRFESPQVRLSIDEGDAEPSLKLTMHQVVVANLREQSVSSTQRTVERSALRWPQPVTSELASRTSTDLLSISAEHYARSNEVMDARKELSLEMRTLRRSLVAQVHERAASAVSCLLVLLMGAVLSIKLRDRMPLVIYFWVFLMALIAVVITNSGEKLAQSGSSNAMGMALLVIWLGNVILAVTLGLNFWKLSRT